MNVRGVAAAAALVALYGAAPMPDLQWRFIGPLRGGRTASVTGVASEPDVFYIAAVNGGIWKTDDAGRTWSSVFEREPTGSIGAIAVAPSNPNVLYAGSGEGLQRPDLSVGDGIYVSNDGGASWRHTGLRDGRQIPTIAVDPRDARRLYVAVLGHPYGPNAERGVYRSTDGGQTFQRVLYVDENTGAYDVVVDPNDSSIVYATLWAARQPPWETPAAESFEVGTSGVFKSTNGGTTWTRLRAGLPARVSRSEIAVAPSNSNIVYAYVNTEGSGASIYRSDDAGAHFTVRNHEPQLAKRGADLASIAVDPHNPNVVYVTNTSTYLSMDGGVRFSAIKGAPGGDDYHAIWINPSLPSHIIVGSDQGAAISLNGGRTWSSWYNQPTAEMYHVSADTQFPYWVCGGQQESGSACVSSRGAWGEVTERDWHPVGSEEYAYIVSDPLHPGVLFGGRVERFDERSGQTREVSPIPLVRPYRMDRTEPVVFDPRNPHRLYFTANVVFATDTAGRSWRTISPDLTRERPAVPEVLGPFERDDPDRGTHRGTIYALAPSFVHEGTIWAGTDDGYVWRTRDGSHWTNVTPPGLGPWSKIAQIDVSHFDDQTAYVAVNRFRLDDLRPYVYRTHDGGKHWRLIVDGLAQQPVNAVRADPLRRGLLYAATENGVAISFDDGARWQSLQYNLPRTSVRDLIVHDGDLAVATHGRGFWIMDDVAPLREIASGAVTGTHFFIPAVAYRVRRDTNTDTPLPPEEPAGQNPPDGAILDYSLGSQVRRVVIEIADGSGRVVRRYSSDDAPPPPIPDLDKPTSWEAPFVRVQTSAGAHRFVWDLRETPPRVAISMQDLPISAVWLRTPRVPEGPLVVPGRYTVRLVVDGHVFTHDLVVRMDPRVRATARELAKQYALEHSIAFWLDRLYGRPGTERLAGDFEALLLAVDSGDGAPTVQQVDAYRTLRARAASSRGE